MAAEQEEGFEQEIDTSSMTLLELEQHLLERASGHGQRLALLQTLAIMCEGLPHTLLLRKPTQVCYRRIENHARNVIFFCYLIIPFTLTG